MWRAQGKRFFAAEGFHRDFARKGILYDENRPENSRFEPFEVYQIRHVIVAFAAYRDFGIARGSFREELLVLLAGHEVLSLFLANLQPLSNSGHIELSCAWCASSFI